MTPDIVTKLNRALSVPITSEEQVVYILVETRKLLERSGKRNTWPTPVAFLCDWVLHIELDRSLWANDLIERAEAAALNDTSFKSLSTADQEFFQQNLTLSAARNAMMTFLAGHRIKSVCLGHQSAGTVSFFSWLES